MVSGFFFGGMAPGISQAGQDIAQNMKLVSLFKYQQQQQQKNQQHADFMQLRSKLVDHIELTMNHLKDSNPGKSTTWYATNPGIVAQKQMLQGYDKNLGLPDTSDSIINGFAEGPSDIQLKKMEAEASGTYGKNQAETSEANARTGLISAQTKNIQNANDTSAGINNTNPNLDTAGDRQATADTWLAGIKDEGIRDDIKGVYDGTTDPSSIPTRTYRGSTKSQRQLVIEGAERYGQLKGQPYDATNFLSRKISQTAGAKADTSALTQLTRQREAVGAFENTAIDNGKTLVALAQKVSAKLGTGIPAIDKYIRRGAQAFGDPDVSALNLQLTSVKNEISKILTNPNLTGQLTDKAREEGNAAIQEGATVQQIINALQTFQTDAGNKKSELDQSISDIKSRLSGQKTQAPPPPPGFNVLGQ